MNRNGNFLTVGQSIKCALLPPGLYLEASQGKSRTWQHCQAGVWVKGSCTTTQEQAGIFNGSPLWTRCWWIGVSLRLELLCMTSKSRGAKTMTPVTALAPLAALLSWSGDLCSHTGMCSFPANTWWMFHSKSFKWMEANCRYVFLHKRLPEVHKLIFFYNKVSFYI